MPIIQKDKSVKDNSLPKDKHLLSGDNNSSKDRLFPNEKIHMIPFFFPEEKLKNMFIISSITLSDMERKYLTFSEFIYNNANGNGYYQTLPSLSTQES